MLLCVLDEGFIHLEGELYLFKTNQHVFRISRLEMAATLKLWLFSYTMSGFKNMCSIFPFDIVHFNVCTWILKSFRFQEITLIKSETEAILLFYKG